MSFFTNIVRGFDEDRFWKYYSKSKNKNRICRLWYTFLYMRMASKQGGYIGRETVFKGRPHFPHGLHGVHISRMAEIGENAIIYQGVTIGAANNGAPKIGCGVMIGANATVIGSIEVGDYVRVGGGTTVVKDVPSYATVVSQSARIIMRDEKV